MTRPLDWVLFNSNNHVKLFAFLDNLALEVTRRKLSRDSALLFLFLNEFRHDFRPCIEIKAITYSVSPLSQQDILYCYLPYGGKSRISKMMGGGGEVDIRALAQDRSHTHSAVSVSTIYKKVRNHNRRGGTGIQLPLPLPDPPLFPSILMSEHGPMACQYCINQFYHRAQSFRRAVFFCDQTVGLHFPRSRERGQMIPARSGSQGNSRQTPSQQ